MGRSRRVLLGGLVALVVVGAGAALVLRELSGGSGSVARADSVLVAPDRAAARQAVIVGATASESRIARASLALVGADAARMRVRFGACAHSRKVCARYGLMRTLTVQPLVMAGRSPSLRAFFLATLAARETVRRLQTANERADWTVPSVGQGVPPPRPSALSLLKLREASKTIASRAARAGWKLAPISLYSAAGGGMLITLRLDDRSLLANRNTAFISTLYGATFRPPVEHTTLIVEGPGGVVEGVGFYGGSDAGGNPTPAPAWYQRAETRLVVTIHALNGNRVVTISCAKGGTSPAALCERMFRDRAVLFSPVQSDNSCMGGSTDSSSVEGVVAGIAVQRDFSNCYGGVTRAWEVLLGLR